MSRQTRDVVDDLIQQHGTTYAEAAGITLRDKPMPLFQLLVLTLLSSTRISADVAVDAARELFRSGWRTPQRLRASTWQQRVDALGRGGYRRYDESTATTLAQLADHVLDAYAGDLRRLHPSDPDGPDGPDGVDDLRAAVEEVRGIGPVGAGIFVREVQAVWPEVGPFFDKRSLERAADLGLPTEPRPLAELAPGGDVARLAAALTRSSLAG